MKFLFLIIILSTSIFANQKDTVVYLINEVNIESNSDSKIGVGRLLPVEKSALYSGRKTELINLSNVNANLANNNTRQIFSKIAGLNIWEGDAGGLQLAIGGRGLSPHRVSNFNTRQNGYDIAADALGYPESYYTPPIEAVDRVEIVRGAASLQYGTQFGGFINFKLQEPEFNQKTKVVSRQSGGSFGLVNTFNSVNTSIDDVSVYSYLHFKRGDGWREFSTFNQFGGHFNTKYYVNDKLNIGFEFTKMYYLTRQAGGLTDTEFQRNPNSATRARNWFEVDWNLFSNIIDYDISSTLKLNIRNFGLIAERNSLGVLERPDRMDIGGDRDLIKGSYLNYGNETRLMKKYEIASLPQTLITGFRVYQGRTNQSQGLGSNASDADFNMTSQKSNYLYPGTNVALFAENLFNITDKFSLTPGIRYEYIDTKAEGNFIKIERDQANNIIKNENIFEKRYNTRNFALLGLGLSYFHDKTFEFYSNFSQNYRAINFSDMRILNPNFKIDPNLKDENGWTYDLGFRGNWDNLIDYDLTFFMLSYYDKIGEVVKVDSALFIPYRERTNVSDARTFGFESVVEFNIFRLLNLDYSSMFTYFINFSLIDAKYINSKDKSIEGNNIELSPNVILKSGFSYKLKSISSNIQVSYMSDQFTEASNTRHSNNAIYGIINEFMVVDLSFKYSYSSFGFETGVNNLFNEMYFTRRAAGYPGPGIIPSDGINFYFNINYAL